MNRRERWLAALMAIAAVALMGTGADAQPKPISSCAAAISAGGSYILNGNLSSTSTTANCITVTASSVTIDLNGFVISGNGGTSTGINSSGNNLAVIDGTITGFGLGIYDTAAGARISNLTVMDSAKDEDYGMYLGDFARVSDSILLNNGSNGISVGANAVVTHCICAGNGGFGIATRSSGAVLAENSAAANGGGGIETSSGRATVEGNAATNNPSFNFADSGGTTYDTNAALGSTSTGFRCGSAISGKILGSCVFVGNVAYGNHVYGFSDAGGSIFRANTADSNGVDGFFAEEGLGFNGNTADSNEVGFAVNCPINLLGNTAEDNTSAAITYSSAGCTCTTIWVFDRRAPQPRPRVQGKPGRTFRRKPQ